MLDACQEKNLQSYLFVNPIRFEDVVWTISVRLRKVIEEVTGSYECEQHAGSEVVPGMGDHAREEIPAHQSDAAEESAVDADENDAAHALVAVGGAEDERCKRHSNGKIVQHSDALRLKVAAEDELFGKSNDEAEQSPGRDLDAVGRSQLHQLPNHFRLLFLRRLFCLGSRCRIGWMGRLACGLVLVNPVLNQAPRYGDGDQDDHGTDPERSCDADLLGDVVEAFWPGAKEGAESDFAQLQSKRNPCDNEEFESAGKAVRSPEIRVPASSTSGAVRSVIGISTA